MDATNTRKIQFATLAIGATANSMGITATELHNRLKRHGLIQHLLFDCYDTLHTESIEDAGRALDILYNSHTYELLANPESGLQLQSDEYIITDLLRELEG